VTGNQRCDTDLVQCTPLGRERPMMSRATSKIASIRRTASIATGALATSATTNSLRNLGAHQLSLVAGNILDPGRV
jgi:hypothetical protein